MRSCRIVRLQWFIGLAIFFTVLSAMASPYGSINEDTVILYDAPSLYGKKKFIVNRYYPVQTIVEVGSWVKVKDSTGTIAWVEKKYVSDKHIVVVKVPVADVRQGMDITAPLIFKAENQVILEFLEQPAPDWLMVRHMDGPIGYIRSAQVWGY